MKVAITAQMRNGHLWEAVKRMGSQVALARHLGVHPTVLGYWLNFKGAPDFTSPSPRHRKRYDEIEAKLAELTGLGLEDIFPAEVRNKAFLKREKRIEAMLEMPADRLIEAGACPALPPMPEDLTFKDERAVAVDRALETLTPREERVIKMRFGIDGGEHTLAEIGAELGICAQRVRQIEQRAMTKLRHPSRSKDLKPFTEGYITPPKKPKKAKKQDANAVQVPVVEPRSEVKGFVMLPYGVRMAGVDITPGLGEETFKRALQALRNRYIRDNAPSRPQFGWKEIDMARLMNGASSPRP